jgi:tRNA-Thr(GGU) m(6)t(6)A37 methyltransferase TsaA
MGSLPKYPGVDDSLVIKPIGVVRSPFKAHADTPRQARGGTEAEGEIILRAGMQNCLKDLDRFSHLWVVFWFNYSVGWNEQVRPPRDTRKRGVLATRAPHRPNPIGLSAVQLLSVHGTRLQVRGIDLLHGTLVLDLKPYLPYADAIPEANSGWLTDVGAPTGPDHRYERAPVQRKKRWTDRAAAATRTGRQD